MQNVENRFGSGTMYSISDILVKENTKIYCECAACLSVYTDMLSYANNTNVVSRLWPQNDKNVTDIIVLGCQVTDLAILNDIRTLERLHEENPEADVYIGGCLAYRFDIELPEYVGRLEVARNEDKRILPELKKIVKWQKPFWITGELEAEEYSDGNLFRNSHPIKIGAGCKGKCKYCTIRDTRGDSYEKNAYFQVKEFMDAEEDKDIVFVSDSPTVEQITDWCHLARRFKKRVSFRNVEPNVANLCIRPLFELAEEGLLNTLHVPIQSNDPEVLKAMNRDVNATIFYTQWSQILREKGVKLATNIIIDYVVDGKVCRNEDIDFLSKNFDYWVWNPYFDGNWDRKKAEERFDKYIK